jgi:hypothetical protein
MGGARALGDVAEHAGQRGVRRLLGLERRSGRRTPSGLVYLACQRFGSGRAAEYLGERADRGPAARIPFWSDVLDGAGGVQFW